MKLWCLARLGTRQPFGAGAENVLTAEEVSPWVERADELPRMEQFWPRFYHLWRCLGFALIASSTSAMRT